MKNESINTELELIKNSERFNYFLNDIQNAYWAENIQLKIFPRWASLANSQELRNSVLDYILMTAEQVHHIEYIFEIFAQQARGKIDTVLREVIHNSEMTAEATSQLPKTADSVILKHLCEIVSYQIDMYQKLYSAAKMFKQQVVSELIEKTLSQELEIFRCFQKLRNKLAI